MRNILSFILGAIEAIFDTISQFFSSLMPEEKKTEYTSAFVPASSLLSRFNHGFAITGNLFATREISHKNMLLTGQTGSGKSSLIVCSAFSLARGKSSVVYMDVSGELHKKLSGVYARKHYRVLKIDPSDYRVSETFNPLLECQTITDIQKLAHLLVRNSTGDVRNDPFWDRSAEALIVIFARLLVFHRAPEFRTLANVLRMLETFAAEPEKIDKLFVEAGGDLLMLYKSTAAIPEKTLQSIIVSTRVALQLFGEPNVIRTTSTNSIDLKSLREVPTVIFICTPLRDLGFFSALSTLFFSAVFNEILREVPPKGARSIYLVLDEMASMKFSSTFSTVVSNCRKFSCGLLICLQDPVMLNLYGHAEAQNIISNCFTRVYLKGSSHATCKEIESMLGRYSYGKKGATRLLMTADEIRMSEEAIIFMGSHPPMKAKVKPYYENILFNHLTKIPPVESIGKGIEEPPKLEFD